ncbi:MAG: hypothetical protein ACRDMV_02355 [Streptosporangiales bacterium]
MSLLLLIPLRRCRRCDEDRPAVVFDGKWQCPTCRTMHEEMN